MAISGGDWSSATDPFVLALAFGYSSTSMDWARSRIIISGSEGLLNGIIDRDIQDLFWQHTTDKDKSWPAGAMHTGGTGPSADGYEFGSFDQDIGGGTFYTFDPNDMIEADPKDASVFLTGRAAGAVLYDLYAYAAYAWTERDPAQILFSWIAHYLDNSIFTMKDFCDQTSFAAASTYYDAKPIGLSVYREVGKTIADQTKKLFDHTADFLAIRPTGAAGTVLLNVLVRGALTDRPTPINLDGNSVASYKVTPTDRYRIDRMDATFGALTMIHAEASGAKTAADYITGPRIEFPHSSRNMASQKVGSATADNTVTLDLPYHRTRDRLLNHLDIEYWKDDADEVEIEFADWTHWNFEAGDIVHLTGAGYDGTENFLVMEKTPDLDTMLAVAYLIQIKGAAGMSPKQADAAHLVFSLRPNSLGNYVDGETTFPARIAYLANQRNLDRWIDESGHHRHATQIDRGTGGPAGANPRPPLMTLDAMARWPVLDFGGTEGLKMATIAGSKIVGPSAAAGDYTMYAVVRVDNVAAATENIWSYSYSGNSLVFRFASGVPKYVFGGTTYGGGSALAGWQIVTWWISAPTSSVIRRNGAVLYSGGSYTAMALSSLGDYAIGCNYAGDSSLFDGAVAELNLFAGAHSLVTVQAIEANLAEKYGIAI